MKCFTILTAGLLSLALTTNSSAQPPERLPEPTSGPELRTPRDTGLVGPLQTDPPETERRDRIDDRFDERVERRSEPELRDNYDDRSTSETRGERWRYAYHNNEWWYWTPNEVWMYWREGKWHKFDAKTFVPADVYFSYVPQRPTPYRDNVYDNSYGDYSYSPGYGYSAPAYRTYRPSYDYYDYYGYNDGYYYSQPYYGRSYYGGYYGSPYYGGYGYGRGYYGSPYRYDEGAAIGSMIGGAIGGSEGASIGAFIGQLAD